MGWTDAQKKAIDERGRNLLVSAAAGSGKTSVLVERIKKMVLEEGASLDRFLVVTFTNAAAAEMRAKIIGALSAAIEGEGAAGDARRKAFLHRQMDLVQQAQISTFHSFAMSIIRRYFHLVGVEPGFQICDEVQGEIMKEESLRELFAEKFETSDPAFLDFVKAYGASRNERVVEGMILSTHKFIQSLPEPFRWLEENSIIAPETEGELFESALWQELRKETLEILDLAIVHLSAVCRMLRDAELRSMEASCLLDLNGLQLIREDFTSGKDRGAALQLADFSFGRFAAGKGETAIYKEVKDDIAPVRELAKDMVEKLQKQYFLRQPSDFAHDLKAVRPQLRTLWGLVRDFDAIFKEKKRAENLLDFSDIEHLALEILAHEDAAAEYREKFDYIFVDEYQDSNLVQDTLISCIRRPDNLFMVGDVKQSIYKFRLAEPEIFIGKYEDYRSGRDPLNEKIDLSRNFRSKGGVVRFVNRLFERIMTKDSCGLAYDESAALQQGTEYEDIYEYEPELYVMEESVSEEMDVDESIRDLAKAEAEALLAARILQEQIGQPFWDCKAGCMRTLRPRDMVVLLRGVKNVGEVYYEALTKVGLPAYVDGGEGLFDQLEVEVFLNLLRTVDNRHQDIPLISVLHSFVFGFKAADLAKIRIHTPKGPYSQAFDIYGLSGPEEDLREKCRAAADRLELWREESRMSPLADFLWKLVLETGYYSYVGGFPQGGRRQANLRALTDRAASFQRSGGGGLFAFIRYIDILRKSRVTVPQEKLPGEDEDMVRIMTIHKSKGLEFPLVLLGGLGRQFGRDTSSGEVSFHKDLGAGIRYVDRERGLYRKTLAQIMISRRKEKESLAEEIRILYVALTRPMDKLILLGTFKGGEDKLLALGTVPGKDPGSFLEMIMPTVRGHDYALHYLTKENLWESDEEGTSQDGILFRRQLEGDAPAPDPVLQEEVLRRLSWAYPWQEAVAARSKYTVSQLTESAGERRLSDRELREPAFLAKEKKRFTAAERGTILHRVLEHLPFTQDGKDPEDIRIYIKEMMQKGLLTDEESSVVDVSAICGFFASDLGRRACESGNLFREMPFVAGFNKEELLHAGAKADVGGEELTLVQGTVDCFFLEDGKAVVIDFKSGYAEDSPEGESHLLDRYRTQLLLYGKALEKIRKIPVAEIHLYSFYLGKDFRIL